MRFIGRREEVSEELRTRMGWAERVTQGNSRMALFVAFNYGGRAETELQKLTDARISEIDTALAGKEEEILEV